MFVIPCKYDPERPVVFDCIKSIQKWHHRPQILVVDSGSEDRSYLLDCLDLGCKVAPINNKNFSFGAHAWAQRHYGEVDFFYFIHDSMRINANLDEFRKRPVTIMRHFSSLVHDWGWDSEGQHLSVWGQEQLNMMGVLMPSAYNGIMGPIFFAQREIIDKLDHMNFWFADTSDKWKLCGMERVAGIVLESIGVDVTQSLQGHHGRHEDPYDETYVTKLNMARF